MYLRNSIIIMGAALLIAFVSPRAAASSDTSEPTQAALPASRLQVTGSKQQFTIEAEHADVQSALKAIFVQADKQFDLASSVAGLVTLKLTAQPLDTVLASVSRQTYLKYHLDSTSGVYHFEQDAEAVKAAFTHLAELNSLLRQQLRGLGLDLPDDAALDTALHKSTLSASPLASRAGRGAFDGSSGGRGGGLGRQESQTSNPPAGANGPSGAADSLRAQDQGGTSTSEASGRNLASKTQPNGSARPPASYKDDRIYTDYIPQDVLLQFLQSYGPVDQPSPLAVDKALWAYLKQNNLIAINTKGVAVPFSDVFAELSKQSGVPILLDPAVPRGPKFRITLTLPACSLNEALNLILPPARLRWRTINNSIWVTPTPDFQIFYGSSPVPNVIFGGQYGNSLQQGNNLNRQNSGAGGNPAGGQGGSPK